MVTCPSCNGPLIEMFMVVDAPRPTDPCNCVECGTVFLVAADATKTIIGTDGWVMGGK
jgi:hypothetical protein